MANKVGNQNFTRGELRKLIAELRRKAKDEIKKWILEPWERKEGVCIWVADTDRAYFNGPLNVSRLDYAYIRDAFADTTLFPRPIEFMRLHLEAGWQHATDDLANGLIIENGNIRIC